jgi:YcaO-like protein with predicted kinase domain
MSAAGAIDGRLPVLAGLPAGRGVKCYRDGAHRVARPEETLKRILSLMPKIGVTRVADLTGLDRLRLPVFAAYRPNSRSLAVFQGKGPSPTAAKVSALMEATETFCAEAATPALRLATLNEIAKLGDVVAVDALPKTRAAAFDADMPILWTAATDIVTGGAVFVPFEIVHANYTQCESPQSGLLCATTNGLASGNDFLEAVAHALYEVIERDAVAFWSLLDPPARQRRFLDLSSIDCPQCLRLLDQFSEAEIDVGVWNITTDIGLPAFHCLIADRAGAADPEIGSGCHPSRSVALMRALTEAAQSRATWISGARDDFEPQDYGARSRARRTATSRDWLAGDGAASFRDAPTFDNADIYDDLAETAASLARADLGQILVVDLTHPLVGVPVARVIVPGLEGVYRAADYIPGVRGERQMTRRE